MHSLSHISAIFIAVIIILQLATRSEADARSQVLRMTCEHERENNITLFMPNFVGMMEKVGAQMRTSRNGTAHVGTGPDGNFGLAQCYGDLSSNDCILCYAEARTVLPGCFPNNGGRIYLDGCFMRVQNYSFYKEISGPNDTIFCGNTTRKSRPFQDTVRQAVLKAVTDASQDSDYFAREHMLVSGTGNESVHVLANCWRTLNSSLCKACLENAYASITKCLPWSEGRALNTGCFMRYSDTDFLNPVPEAISSSSNRGKIIAIVVSIVSSVAVLTIALMIVLYIWKHRYIQKKREGSYDVKRLAKTLKDSSLNFKYSTVEKATGYWDEYNKLGQGGFGTVYKVLTLNVNLEVIVGWVKGMAWMHFQQNKVDEIFDPNLMMHCYPNSNYQKDATKVVQVGLLCTQEDPSLRPSMSTVLEMLAKDNEPLPAPSNPPFMDENTMELNDIAQKLHHYFNRDDSGSVATVSQSHIFPR
ncbi:gnk2-like domain-containing protein [Artemisia annua]|uniref:Gnk2-like domain-containing protein n=1 Tax=Artemisia annua TaxID=35608 RepID=A0A2U1PWH1_ARTAN|nr:gnk2-like domain-containing protein [Artemisia annua]